MPESDIVNRDKTQSGRFGPGPLMVREIKFQGWRLRQLCPLHRRAAGARSPPALLYVSHHNRIHLHFSEEEVKTSSKIKRHLIHQSVHQHAWATVPMGSAGSTICPIPTAGSLPPLLYVSLNTWGKAGRFMSEFFIFSHRDLPEQMKSNESM